MQRGQLLELHLDQAGALLGGVPGLRGDGRDRIPVVLGLARCDDRSVAPLRPEPRDGLRQVGGGHDHPDARHRAGRRRVDRPDARPRDRQRDELDVEDVVERDVGDVRLSPGDAIETADARGRVADHAAHCGATEASGVDATSIGAGTGWVASSPPRRSAARATASMICS